MSKSLASISVRSPSSSPFGVEPHINDEVQSSQWPLVQSILKLCILTLSSVLELNISAQLNLLFADPFARRSFDRKITF
jgi:hypothetical protein